jgi:ATP synthase protein I
VDEPPKSKTEMSWSFGERIGRQEARKIQAQRTKSRSVWFGFAMFGLIGWSVAVPTLLGIALGVWIDKRYPSTHSWTLMLLVIGLIIGCLNAWYWVKKEQQAIYSDLKYGGEHDESK